MLKNPSFEVQNFSLPEQESRLIIKTALRSQGQRVFQLEQSADPEFFKIILNISKLAPESSLPSQDTLPEPFRAWLIEMGIFIPRNEFPKKINYQCLIPIGLGGSQPGPIGKKAWVKSFDYQSRGQNAVFPEGCSAFSENHDIIWVLDPENQIRVPYWVPAELEAPLKDPRRGPNGRPELESGMISTLRNIGALATPEELAENKRAWDYRMTQASKDFLEKGYCELKSLLPPLHLETLGEFCQVLSREGWFHQGKGRLAKRRYGYHISPICYFHHQISHVVQRIVGTKVYPYADMILCYEPGAELVSHRDTAQDEINVSLCLDYRPAPSGPCPWPIFLELPNQDQAVPIHQRIGNALLYRGAELPHFRKALPDKHQSMNLQFSYSFSIVGDSCQQYAPDILL